MLRVALPRADRLELVGAALDRQLEPGTIEFLVGRQAVRIDGGQAPAEVVESSNRFLDGRAREVVQMVVVRVHAIEGRQRRVRLVKPGEVMIDEMLQGLG